MPHPLPNSVLDIVKAQLPANYKIWWIRGQVLDASEVGHHGTHPERNTRVKLVDIDSPDDTYDVVLQGVNYDFIPTDIISVFGHEPVEADHISKPRFLINHNSGFWGTAYDRERIHHASPSTGFKQWLYCQVPLTKEETVKNQRIIFWSVFGFFILSVITLGIFLFIIPVIVFLAVIYALLTSQNPLEIISQKHKIISIEHTYKNVAAMIDDLVEQVPDTNKGFVAVHRGRGQRGKLVE